MSKNQVTGCPNCGCRISFKQFVLLNNFSAINCNTCNARIEISNRNGNAVIAAISGIVSAATIVLAAYAGKLYFNSLLLGFSGGIFFATIFILVICKVLYKRSQLYRRIHTRPIQFSERAII